MDIGLRLQSFQPRSSAKIVVWNGPRGIRDAQLRQRDLAIAEAMASDAITIVEAGLRSCC